MSAASPDHINQEAVVIFSDGCCEAHIIFLELAGRLRPGSRWPYGGSDEVSGYNC